MALQTTVRIRLWPMVATVVVVAATIAIFVTAHREEVVEVHAVRPEYRDVTGSLSTNGKVTPIDEFQARAELAATVEKIYVHVGEKVKPGQLLVKLRDPFAESRYTSAIAGLDGALGSEDYFRHEGSPEDRINFAADLKRDLAERDAAAKRLDLLKQLEQKGSASEDEVSSAEQRLQAASTTLQQTQQRSTARFSDKDLASAAARLADAKANVETAREVLANANITSTIAGTVYSIPISAYDFVPMGADLALVANLDAVQIHAYFDEPDIGQLHRGQPVDVHWDARPGASWRGSVVQPPLTVAPLGSRIVGECLITVDNSNGELLPNTNVTVQVQTGQHLHVESIPREALHTEGSAHFVYRVLKGRLQRTPVSVGIVSLSLAEITGGLTRTDLVAVDAVSDRTLTNGMRVGVSH
jgi:HlyD family secretion protein